MTLATTRQRGPVAFDQPAARLPVGAALYIRHIGGCLARASAGPAPPATDQRIDQDAAAARAGMQGLVATLEQAIGAMVKVVPAKLGEQVREGDVGPA